MTQTDFTGRTLGGYRILRKLGQGGMAVVYKAHEESLKRVVALKVIAQHLSDDEQFMTRFQREAQAAAQLSHPNIVQIYAIGEDDGVHYFSMEYVKGRSLAEVIEEEGFLTAGRALPIITQAAEALAVAHDAGIVHRDIKPANIMLDPSGRAKVADFGIAQISTETRMTQSGMLVGTPEYISPEQCHGEKLDGRSDIYALGITLYQLLSGRTPFDADTPAALVLQIVDGPIPPVGELNPTIPPGVQAIVAKMMHTDRRQRFQSAEDLIHALKETDTQPVTSATRAHPAPAVVAAPDATGEPTVAMLPQDSTVVAPAAPTEAVAPTPQAMPPPEASAPTTEAMPPTEATQVAPAAHGSNNRAVLLGLAAIVLIIITVVFVAWQLGGDSGADETFDPTTEAQPQASPAQEQDAPNSTAEQTERGADPAGNAGSSDAATSPQATRPPIAQNPVEEPATRAAQQPVGQTAPAVARQNPPGDEAEPAVEEEAAFAPPPDNSIVADTSGEYEYVGQVHAWMEGAFNDQDFEVVDFSSSPYPSLRQAARFHVVTNARLVGTEQLQFFRNVQTQFTVSLTSRVNDLATGVTVVGPETTTVKYTAVNMQQNLEKGVTDLARGMAQELRRLIRTP